MQKYDIVKLSDGYTYTVDKENKSEGNVFVCTYDQKFPKIHRDYSMADKCCWKIIETDNPDVYKGLPESILENLSDIQLKTLIEEIQLLQIPEDALIREIILKCFGQINILVLQINQLLWPLLQEISRRMFVYSPHINK